MKIDGKELSKEVLAKAIQCDTPEELVKLAKEVNLEITAEQAAAWIAEMDEIDLGSEQLQAVAGGKVAHCHTKKRFW